MSRKYSELDKRMKAQEKLADHYVNDELPIICRLDGRAFHTFTAGLLRPYCKAMHDLMVETTCAVAKECNADCGYTQSDEISLVLKKPNETSEIFFGARIFKVCSILAATASVFFNKNLAEFLPCKQSQSPIFDCRVFNVPNEKEVMNYLIWRQRDATRNSIQMAGQAYFSHKELFGKSTNKIQEMLFSQHNINWNDYPEFFKRGSLCKRTQYKRYIFPSDKRSNYENIQSDENGSYVFRSKYARVETPIFKCKGE